MGVCERDRDRDRECMPIGTECLKSLSYNNYYTYLNSIMYRTGKS